VKVGVGRAERCERKGARQGAGVRVAGMLGVVFVGVVVVMMMVLGVVMLVLTVSEVDGGKRELLGLVAGLIW
jgi:hypothetical protein